MENVKTLFIRLKKSLAGRLKKQIKTAKSLGLNKIDSSTVQPDNAATRGKLKVIGHLVDVIEQ